MKITKHWLEKKQACESGIVWFTKQKEKDSYKILQLLIKQKRYDWANWLIVRTINYKQCIQYAIYAAKQVMDIFEKKYPNDKRPRQAIEVTKKCIKRNTKQNRTAAAYAAADAARAARAADAAYDAAAYYAANDAAATYAARAADAAYDAAKNKMKLKILKYGMKLIKGELK